MMRALCLTVLLGLAGIAPAYAATADSVAGRKLAEQVYDAPTGDDFASRAVMTLIEKGRKPRKRVMYTIAVERQRGERWSLTRFTDPKDIDGVGLLTKDYPGDNNDQWLYLPALGRVRRVSSGRKGGRFVGSDLFFEDLRDREVEMDHHRYLGERKLGKLGVKVLESVPVDSSNSVYTKRVSYIHPGTLIALRVDLYQAHSDKPVKRLSVKRIKRIQGFWTVLDSVMQDLESDHQTRITLSKATYNQGVPDRVFTSQALADENAEATYRP
ncbi:MAG: outer membrane lipoprotein-sorting protein [Gammaproteobacteria bacterium]|nr:outer membrane lipoprotein-sorting protein [Gammaproteobacteria bacterium]